MALRIALISVLLSTLSCAPTFADESSDKLDLILKEIRQLKQRIGRLEATVAQMSREQSISEPAEEPAPARLPARIPQYPVHPTPAEVIRLQTTTPGVLLKDIHERERVLRKRFFPADEVPLPRILPPR